MEDSSVDARPNRVVEVFTSVAGMFVAIAVPTLHRVTLLLLMQQSRIRSLSCFQTSLRLHNFAQRVRMPSSEFYTINTFCISFLNEEKLLGAQRLSTEETGIYTVTRFWIKGIDFKLTGKRRFSSTTTVAASSIDKHFYGNGKKWEGAVAMIEHFVDTLYNTVLILKTH